MMQIDQTLLRFLQQRNLKISPTGAPNCEMNGSELYLIKILRSICGSEAGVHHGRHANEPN